MSIETRSKVCEYDASMESARLALCATNAIETAMERAGLRPTDIAVLLETHRSRVSKVLDGESNITLRTLAEFGLACGVRWEFVGVKANDAGSVVVSPATLHPWLRKWSFSKDRAFAGLGATDRPAGDDYSLAA